MRPRHDLKAAVRLIAIAVLGVAVVTAVIRIRYGENHVVARQGTPSTNSLTAQLARCRSVTPAQLAANHSCKRVWAENRRLFFASGEPPFAVPNPFDVSQASPKSQNSPAPASSAPHATATDVAPPDSFGPSPLRKDASDPAKQQPAISRSNSSAAAPGEK
jgi:conjugative transfer region protein TrbK